MAYPLPPESKSAVKRAGKLISEGVASEEDYSIVDQWRSSHGYVINTFKIFIKRKIAALSMNVEFAQRLKRRNTVFDKLARRNASGELLISDVSAMHDFAGCRLIFDNLEDLRRFRSYMHSQTVMKNVSHVLRYPPEKYDYIEHPKESGYRGIHDVYRHLPRGSERAEGKKPWDNLLVEIQYRTRAQHAWATAVEISDLVDGEKTKFEMKSLPGNMSTRKRHF
jgi:putative GTP pyrophosphokinase